MRTDVNRVILEGRVGQVWPNIRVIDLVTSIGGKVEVHRCDLHADFDPALPALKGTRVHVEGALTGDHYGSRVVVDKLILRGPDQDG